MTEFLVSNPRYLLLVRESSEGIEETTLVVPDLPVTRLSYARLLVDAGPAFEEHAVAWVERALSVEERRVVDRSLAAARPTRVTVVRQASEQTYLEGSTSDPGCAAAAVCRACEDDSLSEGAPVVVKLASADSVRSLFVERAGRFFVVRVASD